MGFCSKCRDFFPPDFMDNNLCHFCKKESNTIMTEDGILYNKGDVVKDYKIFLNKLKEKGSVKDINFESMVRQGLKNSE